MSEPDKYRNVDVDTDTIAERLREHIETACSDDPNWDLITEAYVVLRWALPELEEANDRIEQLEWDVSQIDTGY